MAKNPVLPLYYNDISGSTQDWTDEEFGAYMRLLIYQWDKGFIPLEMQRLKRIAESVEKNWPVLCQKFTPGQDGLLQNSVMEKIRIEREKFLRHQTDNGKLGGRPRKENPNRTQTKSQNKPKKKPLEEEIEEEIEFENEIERPFTSEKFQILWQNWKDYRQREFRKKYKSSQSEQAALAHLVRISGGSEDISFRVIQQSIANQWMGLFELKDNNQNASISKKYTGKSAGAHQIIDDIRAAGRP